MIWDEVVFLSGDFAIVRSIRLFDTGFNCYERSHPGSDKFKKINPIANYFITFEDAMEYLGKHKEKR